jgi:hypothetical protein
MPFPKPVREDALFRSRRCCCVCQEFAGVYTNVHHIVPEADGGADTLDNAIVLCLRCHGEAGHYNPRHPIGSKYSPGELRNHRDAWWNWCDKNPGAPLPKAPLSVSPTFIALGKKDWKSNFILKVYNKAADPYYQIYVKLRILSPEIQPLDIEIATGPRDPNLKFDVGSTTVSTDAYRLTGWDEAGRRCPADS